MKRYCLFLCFIVFSGTFAQNVFSESISSAYAAYDKGDFPSAYQIFLDLAEQGDPESQAALGNMYELGQGMPLNYNEAFRWYSMAANLGNAKAQCKLGTMYDFGKGMPKNYNEAVRWYRLAAEQGEVDAQYFLAQMYYLGWGVTQSNTDAYAWFEVADANGHRYARMRNETLETFMTASQVVQGKQLGKEILERTSESQK